MTSSAKAKKSGFFAQLLNCFRDGDVWTRLSALIMGLGNLRRGQVIKGLWAKIPADGHTTLTKPYLAGQSEDGKNIWKDEKTTVINRELKSMVEFYKKDLIPKYDIPEL